MTKLSLVLLAVIALMSWVSHAEGDSITGEKSLHAAAMAGDLQTVRMLLEDGSNVDAADEDGATALHLAVINGHIWVVELLLESGADVNKRDKRGRTALHRVAPISESITLNKLRDELDALPYDSPDRKEIRRMLTRKIVRDTWAGARLATRLLRAGADINARTATGSTPLHLAARKESAKKLISVLLAKGADVNAQDENGWVPLHLTATDDRIENATLLLAGGADVNASGIDVERVGVNEDLWWATYGEDGETEITGWSVLHEAAVWDSGAVFELLLVHGADHEAVTSDGRDIGYLLDILDSTAVELVIGDWNEELGW